MMVERIVLEKQGAGLGFTIRGGAGNGEEDAGIYVTSIKANGAAARSGRISIGDKILEIDDNDLRSVTHSEAVTHFHQTSDHVILIIEKKHSDAPLQDLQNSRLTHLRHSSLWIPVTAAMCVILGLPLAYLVYRKFR